MCVKTISLKKARKKVEGGPSLLGGRALKSQKLIGSKNLHEPQGRGLWSSKAEGLGFGWRAVFPQPSCVGGRWVVAESPSSQLRVPAWGLRTSAYPRHHFLPPPPTPILLKMRVGGTQTLTRARNRPGNVPVQGSTRRRNAYQRDGEIFSKMP